MLPPEPRGGYEAAGFSRRFGRCRCCVAARGARAAKRNCRQLVSWARLRLSAWSKETIAFAQRLLELGWTEGQTVLIERRWGESRSEALCRYRRRVRPSQGRCDCYGRSRSLCGKARDKYHPHRFCGGKRPARRRLGGELGAPRALVRSQVRILFALAHWRWVRGCRQFTQAAYISRMGNSWHTGQAIRIFSAVPPKSLTRSCAEQNRAKYRWSSRLNSNLW